MTQSRRKALPKDRMSCSSMHSTCSIGHELVTGVSVQIQHSALHIILTTLSKKPPVEEFRSI